MSNRRANPEPLDVTRPRIGKSLHVIPCSERSNSPAIRARPEVVSTDPNGPVPQFKKNTPLTSEQQKLLEDMEWRQVDLDWNQPPGHPRRQVLKVPKVVFEEAYQHGPPAAGTKPRHSRYEDMLLAGAEAVVRAARTFNPEFGDGKIDFAEYARPGVRNAVAEQANDRLIHVPRRRQREWPREELVPIDSWDENSEFSDQESRTSTRSRWAAKLERAAETLLRVPTEEHAEDAEEKQEAALLLRQQWAEDVLSAWGLTPREQRAVILRYGLNGANLGPHPSFAEIGVVMGVSAERARQLVRNAEQRLKKPSPEATQTLDRTPWSQYRGRSSGTEKHRPAWEDDVVDRVEDLSEKRKREQVERVIAAA